MTINKLVNFTIEKVHSSKKNKDYYAICMVINDVKSYIAWLSERDYNSIVSKLS